MNRLNPALAVSLALSACAAGPNPRGPGLRPAANPSDVISAELAFARLAQEKGQWTAFRQTSTSDAVMFVPQRVRAQDWLKGRADPATAVRWQPSAVWSSCDGSYAVTQGQWRSANASGGFVTVWQRQGDPRRPTGYKWVLDMSVTTEHGTASPDTIAAKVADCDKIDDAIVPGVMDRDGAVLDDLVGSSTDATLVWNSSVRRDGGRKIEVWVAKAGKLDTVLELDGRDID
jgi:hypothetical protein